MDGEESVAAILADLRTKLSAEIDLVTGIGGGNRQTEETLRAGRRNSRRPVPKVLVSGKEATRSLDRLLDVSGARDGRKLLDNCKTFSRKTLSASLYLLREHFMERDHGKKNNQRRDADPTFQNSWPTFTEGSSALRTATTG